MRAIFILLTVILSSANAQELCDTLAASPTDAVDIEKVDGVALLDIKAEEAIAACEAAIHEFPGTARYHYQLGRAHRTAGHFDLYVSFYQKAANMGYQSAMIRLGELYQIGVDVEQSDDQAVYWYRVAAELGNAVAKVRLADLYEQGYANWAFRDEAKNLFLQAAEAGHRYAQYKVGYSYGRSWLDQESYYAALEWHKKSADQGYPLAYLAIADLYRWNNYEEKSSDDYKFWSDKGVQLLTLYSEAGDANAQYNLGILYLEGEHVPQSNSLARYWVNSAANEGSLRAQYMQTKWTWTTFDQ